jgi:hypothetical protein
MRHMSKPLFTARAAKSHLGWIVTVDGVPSFQQAYEDPTEPTVRTDLANVLGKPSQSFDLRLDRDVAGLGSRSPF